MFVKKFKPCKIRINQNTGTTTPSLEIIDETANNETNELIEISDPNELLHLASSYGDIFNMCYAIALNADKNSIIDKATTSEEMKNERDYKQMGYTPLIKAVLSVYLTSNKKTIIFDIINRHFKIGFDSCS